VESNELELEKKDPYYKSIKCLKNIEKLKSPIQKLK
jgi:hypothetical protein